MPGALRKAALFAPSFLLMSTSTLSPALAQFARQFPDASNGTIQLLITLPFLVAFPLVLLSGVLSCWFTKKRIVLVSIALMMVGAYLPLAYHDSLGFLLGCSALYGVGFGAISPLTSALITEHFEPAVQGKMLGFQSATIGLGGILFSFLGGRFANGTWWHAYFAYAILIPVFLLSLLMPEGRTESRGAASKGVLSGRLFYYLAMCVMANIGFNVFLTNISFLVSESGFGTAQTAGVVVACNSLGSILGGLVTGFVLAKTGRQSLTFIFGVSAAGMLVVFLSGTLGVIFAGTATIGFVFAMRMPAGYLKSTAAAPPESGTLAIALYCACSQVGQFFSPIVMNGIAAAIHPQAKYRFLVAGLLLVVLTAISFFWERAMEPAAPA